MKKDDWEKPRSKGQHLSAAEIDVLRESYRKGRHYSAAARELKCSSRIACKYYGFFKAEGIKKGEQPSDPSEIASRFYRSSFEI